MSVPRHGSSSDARTLDKPSPLQERLRNETAGLHRQLETQLALLDPHLSIDRYREVLRVFLGFYAPIEVHLGQLALAVAPPITFPLRARAELLERDLLALGASRGQVAELARCADLPRLICIEDIAGCLYVLEGACLGGQVIAPVLQRRLGLTRETGASFFIGGAEATSARWRRVLSWLESLPSAGARSEDIVAAACATFSALGEWVTRQGASREGRHGRPDRL
jgi:heme oxygenase